MLSGLMNPMRTDAAASVRGAVPFFGFALQVDAASRGRGESAAQVGGARVEHGNAQQGAVGVQSSDRVSIGHNALVD